MVVLSGMGFFDWELRLIVRVLRLVICSFLCLVSFSFLVELVVILCSCVEYNRQLVF